MIVTGGCCHDYSGQSKILIDTLNAVMPINWTVVQGMNALPEGRLPLFENANWARGQDIVIHNECWANGDLPAQIVQNITSPAVPRMFFHCALHSYRIMKNDAWRELIGVTSRTHTSSHNISLKWADNDPITAGLPPFVTPIDELYVIEKVWPGTKAIATALNDLDNEFKGNTYPVVWTNDSRSNARVFGTSLGHVNETFNTNQFKELVTRGFRWALKKEPIALPRPVPARRGGGAARGAAPAGPSAPPTAAQ
jgi:type 1 glutamine amidotransferase